MHPYLAEFLGTTLMVLLGTGVVANTFLTGSKGKGGGWVMIALGWGMAIFIACNLAEPYSGAHLNPAVSVYFAMAGKLPFADLAGYVAAQFAGGILGASLMYACYRQQFVLTDNPADKLGVFCNSPSVRHPWSNILTEFIATMALLIGIVALAQGDSVQGSLKSLPVALLILSIGLSLGGPTGYAINPARDMGPRIAHALLPIPGKGKSDWAYGWIPVAAPLLAAAVLGWCMRCWQ